MFEGFYSWLRDYFDSTSESFRVWLIKISGMGASDDEEEESEL